MEGSNRKWRIAFAGGGEKSRFRWAIAGGGERSQGVGSDRRWRGSQGVGSDRRWRAAIMIAGGG